MSGLVLILLGAPGAGKGTYCKELTRRYDAPQISTGDMFRAAVKEGSELGKSAAKFMEVGALVPDEMVITSVAERIKSDDCAKGFILDGFPRTVEQADALVGLLSGIGKSLRLVINLDVDRDMLLRRLSGRRMCSGCEKGNFNVYTLKPKVDGKCDHCGAALYQREDDKEETILKRLKVYDLQTKPLIEYYGKRGMLVNVAPKGSIEDVLKTIYEVIDSRPVKA